MTYTKDSRWWSLRDNERGHIRKQFTLPRELYAQIAEAIESENISFSAWLRHIIEAHFARKEKPLTKKQKIVK